MDNQAKQQELTLKAQMDERKHAMEMEKMQMQAQFDQQEHQFKMAELQAKMQMSSVVNASKMRVAEQTAALTERQAAQAATAGAAQ